jgi:hypothetical protein
MYYVFDFNLMALTLLSSFQALLKETEVAENTRADAIIDDHREGAIDAEVTRITSENLMTSDGLDTVEVAPRESTDDTD